MTAFVYRCFDEADRLLYVGFTVNVARRMGQHRLSSPWFCMMRRFDVANFESKSAALAEERRAITSERPLCNDAGNSAIDRALMDRLISSRPSPSKQAICLTDDVVGSALLLVEAVRIRRSRAKLREAAIFGEAKARGFSVAGIKRVLRARADSRWPPCDEQLISSYQGVE